MKYNEIINQVADRGGLPDRSAAERATNATLEVLGERLAGNEPSNFAAQLPAELQPLLNQHTGAAEDYNLDEFVRRVAERHGNGTAPEQAEHNIRTVLAVIGEFVSEGELNDLRSQLPAGYEGVLPS